MNIYNFIKETKEFISQSTANPNPLEVGKYLIPANATTIEVLPFKDGFKIVFDEELKEWEYLEIPTIYVYEEETKEYLKSHKDTFLVDFKKFNLLEQETIKEPLSPKDGYAVCFNGTKWEYVEDNRNTVVYNKEAKQESKIDYLGKIKDDVTISKPEQFDKWDYKTNSWVCDEVEKEKARVQNINSYTQSYITTKYPLEKQSSANLGIYGEEYKNEMISFISNCINLSNEAIDNGASFEDYKAMLNEY